MRPHHDKNNPENRSGEDEDRNLQELINRLQETVGHTAVLDYEDNKYINIMGYLNWVDQSKNQAYLTKVTTGKGRHMDEFYANIDQITGVTKLKRNEEHKQKQRYSENDPTYRNK